MAAHAHEPPHPRRDHRPRRTLPLAIIAVGLFAVQVAIFAVALLVSEMPV